MKAQWFETHVEKNYMGDSLVKAKELFWLKGKNGFCKQWSCDPVSVTKHPTMHTELRSLSGLYALI